MEQFPNELEANSISLNLNEIRNKYVTSMLRAHIHRHIILRHNDNEFVDIEKFVRGELELDSSFLRNEIPRIIKLISNELADIGWKTGLSYNDTGLFIYSGNKPPSCW